MGFPENREALFAATSFDACFDVEVPHDSNPGTGARHRRGDVAALAGECCDDVMRTPDNGDAMPYLFVMSVFLRLNPDNGSPPNPADCAQIFI